MRRVVDTRAEAEAIRSTFYGKAARRAEHLQCTWPKELILCGTVISVMYSSDKWYFDKEYRDYMHIAEAPQDFLSRKDFVRERDDGMRPVKLYGEAIELLEPMPMHIAKLAPCIGLRVDLFTSMSRGTPKQSGDAGVREIRTPGGLLGGAKHPTTKEPFLVIYTKDRVHCLITGPELDIKKDGIIG